MGRLLLALSVSLGALHPTREPSPAPSIRVYPAVAFAPLDTLSITARIPRDPDNRAFCVAAILGEVITRRSCGELAGDSAPLVQQIQWHRLTDSGEYAITLTVGRSDGHVSTATTPLLLKGIDDDDSRPDPRLPAPR